MKPYPLFVVLEYPWKNPEVNTVRNMVTIHLFDKGNKLQKQVGNV